VWAKNFPVVNEFSLEEYMIHKLTEVIGLFFEREVKK
jgi:hypothetical protein